MNFDQEASMKLNFESTSIRCLLSVCLIAVLLSVASPAWSQETTATINGTVTDPSGAPIVGATVTATDVARGTDYPTQTNTAGAYSLSQIPIGTYRVKV